MFEPLETSFNEAHDYKSDHFDCVQRLESPFGALKFEVDMQGDLRDVRLFYPGGEQSTLLNNWQDES